MMIRNPIVTPELLAELIHYFPDTGKMYWRGRSVRLFANAADALLWNDKHAGEEIFRKPNANGYKHQTIFGANLFGHRVAWAIHYGKWPEGQIDHINGQGRDNRICNLRDVGAVVNSRNKVMLAANTSGVTGVSVNQYGTFTATIGGTYLGTFKTLEEAAICRAKAQAETPGYTGRHGKPRIKSVGFENLRQEKRLKKIAFKIWNPKQPDLPNDEIKGCLFQDKNTGRYLAVWGCKSILDARNKIAKSHGLKAFIGTFIETRKIARDQIAASIHESEDLQSLRLGQPLKEKAAA